MKKKLITFTLISFCLLFVLSLGVSAVQPYDTYTYSIDGEMLLSPTAYSFHQTIDSNKLGLSKAISNPTDLFVAPNGWVYIADPSNNRILVLDQYFNYQFSLDKFTNDQGVAGDALAAPNGVFVNEEHIYVCDTNNNRIVRFYLDGTFDRIIPRPKSNLFGDQDIYKPVAMAVDQYGRIFVVSSTTYQGIIVMTQDGTFTGFIGAQKVEYSMIDIIWRRYFMTDEQRAQLEDYVSTEYNNITIDNEGFIYVTTSAITSNQQQSAIKSKNADYSPVKKLNSRGDEIMKRNGFFNPGGEVMIDNSVTAKYKGASRIVDVAIGPQLTWSIIDETRNKVFTYDQNGNLLFAFGDYGQQGGNLQSIEAVTYQGNYMLLLDKISNNFNVYKRTEYGDLLLSAIENENNRQYDQAINYWVEILKRNNNFDAAYIGIGKALYRENQYDEAIEYFQAAYDTENYSDAYKEIRKEWISKYLIVIPIVIIVVVVLWLWLMKVAKRINYDTSLKVGRKTYGEELMYVFHLIFHPFDGFWDLKHEKRGSLRAALTIFAVVVVAFYYQAVGQGYVVNPHETYTTIFGTLLSIAVPLLLWAIANWCLTTLFEGEGSFKDILIASCYAVAPMVLTVVPATLLSNIVTAEEAQLVSLIVTIGFIWSGMLLFFGMMVTHDYSLGKNVGTTIGTIGGMVIIMFVAVLFTSLLGKMLSFISSIIVELNYRM